MNSKKVCIVAPIHIWNDVRVFKKQAVSLESSGYEVSLIARMPKDHDGSTFNAIKLIRSKLSDEGKLFRILLIYKVFFQALNCKSDLYHLHNPNTIPIVFLLRLFGKKVIYDTHEDFSQRLLFREWIPNHLRKVSCRLVSLLERITGKVSNGAIGTQPAVVRRLGNKAILIGNQPRYNENLFKQVDKIKHSLKYDNSVFRLVYLGSINRSRGISDIVNALEIINKKSSVRLWLLGEIANDYMQELKVLQGWKYVDYLGCLEQEVAFSYVSMSDLGVIYIHDVGDHAFTDPNKLYEYMTFGTPFIASDFNHWKDKLRGFEAGSFISPNAPRLFANKVIELIDKPNIRKTMGESGLLYVSQNNWDIEFEKLKKLYSEII